MHANPTFTKHCLRSGLVLVLSALAACHTVPPPSADPMITAASPSSRIIYVVRRGWHIDIGFAAVDLEPPLASLRADFPADRYLLFGFGDRHYLLARNQRFNTLFAALWRGPGLVLATGLVDTPRAAFGSDEVVAVVATAAQTRALQTFVWRTLEARGESARPLADGPYAGSRFYDATRSYSAFYTCNTWAAQALHTAALPIDSRRLEFAGQLWRQLRQACARQLTCTAG